MKRNEAQDLCCALQEIARALEQTLERTEQAEDFELPDVLLRALGELYDGLTQVLDVMEPERTPFGHISDENARVLTALGTPIGYRMFGAVLGYLVQSMVDGVRRPGSWERGVVAQLFGQPGIDEALAVVPPLSIRHVSIAPETVAQHEYALAILDSSGLELAGGVVFGVDDEGAADEARTFALGVPDARRARIKCKDDGRAWTIDLDPIYDLSR